jgi:hypothetical protein
MRRVFIIFGVAVVALAAAAVAGVGRPDAARGEVTPRHDVVTTSGRGVVTTVPDVATVAVGVRSEASTAGAALEQTSAQVTRVIAALRQAGGERLQTQQVSLYPQNDDKGTTTGFVAQNTVTARSSIATSGRLVDAAVAAGANTVDGPSLERSDRDALYRDALKKALADAKAKAEALAEAGGFAVGRVTDVTEQQAAGEPVPMASAAAAKDAATPVEPGTQDVVAQVSVSFEIT